MATPTLASDEIVDFIALGTNPQTVISFRPSPAAQARIDELVKRRVSGQITEPETAELADYLHLEHLMIMAKARARQHLASGV